MKVSVVGASGYAGGELLRLLDSHPQFTLQAAYAHNNAGESITKIHPHLTHLAGTRFRAIDSSEIEKSDLIFLALPHGKSHELIAQLRSDIPIVDLGADFRLQSESSWKKYYGGEHPGTWLYGLPELLAPAAYFGVKRVANPGCYATAISLACAPALASSFVADSNDVVVVAASGTTGAGRTLRENLLGSEVMNSLTSYKFGGTHQHTPEIEESLKRYSQRDVKISFTPILAPMPRGILATITMKIVGDVSLDQIRSSYGSFCAAAPFLHLLETGEMPSTSSVLGTNNVHMQVALDTHTSRIIISCAIDNLGKGAAGQAIQNANIISGFDQTLGLNLQGIR